MASSGDYTQWYVARDHDDLVYYVRTYDSWVTDAHDLSALCVFDPATKQRTLPLLAACSGAWTLCT